MLYLLALLMVAGMPAGQVTVSEVTVVQIDSTGRPRSPQKAFLYSALGTAVPFAVASALSPQENIVGEVGSLLGVTGLIVGPALGHFYASSTNQAWLGMGFRFAGLVIMATGFVLFIGDVWGSDWEGPGKLAASGSLLIIAGGAALIGSAIYDIAKAGPAARRYNRQHGLVALQAVPVYFAQAKAPGLALRARF